MSKVFQYHHHQMTIVGVMVELLSNMEKGQEEERNIKMITVILDTMIRKFLISFLQPWCVTEVLN